jgi:hypothetical protein
MKISLYSYDQKHLESEYLITDNQEFPGKDFTFKFIDKDKMVLSIQEKKLIVKFNEIFKVMNEQFVFFNEDKIKMLKFHPQNKNKFHFLIQNKIHFIDLIKKVISLKITPSKSNLYYAFQVILILFIFGSLFHNESTQADPNFTDKSIIAQQKIYSAFSTIEKNAKEEEVLTPEKPEIKTEEVIENKSQKKIFKENKPIKRKETTLNAVPTEDSDIAYFMKFKKKHK